MENRILRVILLEDGEPFTTLFLTEISRSKPCE
jgi:hypothetical protein